MKKFTLLLISLAAVVSLTACMGANDVKNAGEDVKNNVEQGVEATKDKVGDVVNDEKNMMNDVKNDVTRATENIAEFTSNGDKNVDRTSFITEEMAKQIAVEKAGINPNDAGFIKVDFDKDDNRYVYEIEFKAGNTEYEAEVSAADGTILSWDVDKHD